MRACGGLLLIIIQFVKSTKVKLMSINQQTIVKPIWKRNVFLRLSYNQS